METAMIGLFGDIFPNMKNFYKLYLNNKGEVNHYNKYGNQQIYQTLKDHLCSK